MTAELILGLVAFAFVAGFMLGDLTREREARDQERERIQRVRWLYTGIKDW